MDNIRYYYKKCLLQLFGLFFLLCIQVLFLTKLVKYGKIDSNQDSGVNNIIDPNSYYTEATYPPKTQETSANNPEVLMGDLNFDNVLSQVDVDIYMDYLTGKTELTPEQQSVANIKDDDDVIDHKDVRLLKKLINEENQ